MGGFVSVAAALTGGRLLHVMRPCTRRHPASFCMSLRGAKRRGNPFSLQQHKTKSNSSRQIRRSCEFALCTTVLPGISAGKRIAAPVCALVRNDMQKAVACQRLQGVVRNDMLKTDTCQRLQGRGAQGARKHAGCQRLQGRFGSIPAVPRYCADTRQVSACHCEERSDVAIRFSCGRT